MLPNALIRDPCIVHTLTEVEARPGLVVLHQHSQWRATIVAVDWPLVTLQYAQDTPDSSITLHASRLVALWRVQRRPDHRSDVT